MEANVIGLHESAVNALLKASGLTCNTKGIIIQTFSEPPFPHILFYRETYVSYQDEAIGYVRSKYDCSNNIIQHTLESKKYKNGPIRYRDGLQDGCTDSPTSDG